LIAACIIAKIPKARQIGRMRTRHPEQQRSERTDRIPQLMQELGQLRLGCHGFGCLWLSGDDFDGKIAFIFRERLPVAGVNTYGQVGQNAISSELEFSPRYCIVTSEASPNALAWVPMDIERHFLCGQEWTSAS
jgi:hypothetical protein